MSLTLAEARARAAALSAVAYDLSLDLRDAAPGGTFGMRVTVDFSTTTAETFLELAAGLDVTVTTTGTWAYDGHRIRLGDLAPGPQQVTVTARVPYVSDGDGMHLFVDPADGATYVSAYVGIDITQRVFACFDQVDLKAPLTLSVTCDPTWTVLANGRARAEGDQDAPGEHGTWHFATTPPIPIDNTVVCAGPWHSVRWEHAGLPFGWHARASLAAELDRDADELRRITEACYDHYAAVIDEPYPFDGYDQALVPGLNWGALEMPGCIIYRDELVPRGRVTAQLATRRAAVIAHEMSHMWFGNLVTMRWWEDTWLNESFADYMGFRVAAEAAGYDGAQASFEVSRKPGAHDADARRSTHPVAPLAEDVGDVDTAFNNFDAISYAKGNASLRQLVTWLSDQERGDADFLAGVNAHLTRHAWGNATLSDLVDALDAASERDVRSWVELWLRRPGIDVLRLTHDADGVPVLSREGERPHRLVVHGYDDRWALAATRWVDLDDDPVALPEMTGLQVVPNAHGETLAAMRLTGDDDRDEVVTEGLGRIADPLVRAVLWAHLFERVQAGDLPAADYLDLVAAHLPAEPDATIVSAVLARTAGAVLPRQVAADDVARARDVLAGACLAGLAQSPTEGDGDGDGDGERRHALRQGVAAHARDPRVLTDLLGDEADPSLRWTVLHRLAETGAPDAERLVADERARDTSYAGELGAARALAARPTEQAKAQAWESMGDPAVANRMFEALAAGLWSGEQAALCAPYVDRYLAEGPHLAERRGQAFSQVVGHAFPSLPLTPAQLDAVGAALADPDRPVPTVLRRHWEDALDDRT